MKAGGNAVAFGMVEYPVGLFNCEKSLLAEHVHIVGKPFGRHSRNHLAAHIVDIFLLPALIGTAYGMCSKEC